MSGLSLLTFLVIGLCCYATSSSNTIRDSEHHQVKQQLNSENHIDAAADGNVEGGGSGGQGGAYHHSGSAYATDRRQSSHATADEVRPKRSQRDVAEYKDLNDIIEDLEDNTIAQAQAAVATAPLELDLENMPPLTYYLLLQKLKQLQSNEPTYRVRTPRLGRSVDFQQWQPPSTLGQRFIDAAAGGGGGGGGDGDGDGLDNIGRVSRQFVSRVFKKSVPFKPRLGKRAQMCDRNN